MHLQLQGQAWGFVVSLSDSSKGLVCCLLRTCVFVRGNSCFCQIVSHATLCPQQALTPARQVAVSTRCLSGSQRLVAGAWSHVGCGSTCCRDLDAHNHLPPPHLPPGTSLLQCGRPDAGRAVGWQHPVPLQPVAMQTPAHLLILQCCCACWVLVYGCVASWAQPHKLHTIGMGRGRQVLRRCEFLSLSVVGYGAVACRRVDALDTAAAASCSPHPGIWSVFSPLFVSAIIWPRPPWLLTQLVAC